MSDSYKLDPKVIHLPNKTSIVVCTGMHIVATRSKTDGAGGPIRPAWRFVAPKDGPKVEHSLRTNSDHEAVYDFGDRLTAAGYELPEAYGLSGPTELSNIIIKSRVIVVRVNSEGESSSLFSFQYNRFNFTSYDEAMQNAISLRNLLIDQRKRLSEYKRIAEQAREVMRTFNLDRRNP